MYTVFSSFPLLLGGGSRVPPVDSLLDSHRSLSVASDDRPSRGGSVWRGCPSSPSASSPLFKKTKKRQTPSRLSTSSISTFVWRLCFGKGENKKRFPFASSAFLQRWFLGSVGQMNSVPLFPFPFQKKMFIRGRGPLRGVPVSPLAVGSVCPTCHTPFGPSVQRQDQKFAVPTYILN